uniref:non-homologous end joining protein Ku n=1 Tax=Pararhizobium arenae TaxID=1856850 RepID=UPI00094ADAF6
LMIDPEEVAAVVPDADKMLDIEAFIPCGKIDDIYFDKPYYLVPSDEESEDAFAAIRDALKNSNTIAVAQTVLFRRIRTVLIRAHGRGLIATTLNHDYEVRSSKEAFEDVPKVKVEAEMLDLAKHIIGTKKGDFDPATFEDRYENALEKLVEAKAKGKSLPKPKPIKVSEPSDLLAALRESVGAGGDDKKKTKPASANRKKKDTKPTRKTTKAKLPAKTKQKKAS